MSTVVNPRPAPSAPRDAVWLGFSRDHDEAAAIGIDPPRRPSRTITGERQ